MKYAKRVFEYAITNLQKISEICKTVAFQDAVDVLSTHRVWTMGIGKAGLAARKLSSTLACNGRPAAFIHAGEALHGDFGRIQCGDALVSFSNSGKTDEVIQVADKSKNIGAFLILITSDKEATIAKKADIVLCYGKIKEACPLGLTPTTSTIIMMALADALAMEVQVKVGLDYKTYAINHHAGYLGQAAKQRSR
jgi:arabinose-5-phosphate isomerase